MRVCGRVLLIIWGSKSVYTLSLWELGFLLESEANPQIVNHILKDRSILRLAKKKKLVSLNL